MSIHLDVCGFAVLPRPLHHYVVNSELQWYTVRAENFWKPGDKKQSRLIWSISMLNTLGRGSGIQICHLPDFYQGDARDLFGIDIKSVSCFSIGSIIKPIATDANLLL